MGGHPGIEITLVSRENSFVITPLLFEACSGRLDLRHCAQPIRAALRLRIVLDWTVARFFRPEITKVELRVEREQVRRRRSMAAVAGGGNDRRD